MNTSNLRPIILSALFLMGAATAAPSQITYRFVVGTGPYQQPSALVEVLPLVFDSVGSPSIAFSVTPQGQLTALDSFSPSLLESTFIPAANGRAYSVISTGSLVSIGPSPGSKQVYANPNIAVSLSQNLLDGTLLGSGDNGTNYSLVKSDLNGNVTSFFQFPAGQTVANVLYGTDGNYYGLAFAKGQPEYIYRVSPSGTLATLVSGLSGGGGTNAFLQGTDGNLYGATGAGGANHAGSIYKVSLSGQYTLLYSFTTWPNKDPYWLIQGSDGNLYGATYGNGRAATLFQVTTSGQYTLLHTMAAGDCACGLTLGSDGNIYGDATGGGPTGSGFIFALEGFPNKPAPQALSFSPAQGPVGTRVRIWGYNLFYSTVQFNGTASTRVANAGSNYVYAIVPAGATTGPITVVTPGGSSTTAASFVVQ
jgi:uncharacterized repeat protein (TIGR03803 family)